MLFYWHSQANKNCFEANAMGTFYFILFFLSRAVLHLIISTCQTEMTRVIIHVVYLVSFFSIGLVFAAENEGLDVPMWKAHPMVSSIALPLPYFTSHIFSNGVLWVACATKGVSIL